MNFNWINGCNALVIAYLIVINLVSVRRGKVDQFSSQHFAINLFEQLGRYASMFFMIVPIGNEFYFHALDLLYFWSIATILLLIIYSLLWLKKSENCTSILYILAIIPVLLFLMNGIILWQPMLIISAVIFGIFHIIIVKENIKKTKLRRKNEA